LPRREFERVIEARETIYRLFDATARGKAPAAADLETLNGLLAASPARTTFRRERNGFSWDVNMRAGTALGQLAPVLSPRLDPASPERRLASGRWSTRR